MKGKNQNWLIYKMVLVVLIAVFILSAVVSAQQNGADNKELIFSGELNESFYISEADLYLEESGYLSTEFVVDPNEEHPDVVLSPGFEITERGLPGWINNSQRTDFQAYFSYTESTGPVNVPDDTTEDEIAAHITEFGEEACFGIMFGKDDCIDLDSREDKFYDEVKSSSDVEFEETERHLVANFEYEGNPYLTLRDGSGVINQAEREGQRVKVPHSIVKGELCAYVYGVEVGCEDTGQKQIEILTDPVEQRNDGLKVYSLSNSLEVKLNEVENPEAYDLTIIYDEKGKIHVPENFGNPSPRIDYEIEGTTIDISEKIKAVSENLDGETYQIYIQLDDLDSKGFYVTSEAEEPEATIRFGKDQYSTGENIEAFFEAQQSGKYRVEVNGPELERRLIYDEGQDEATLGFSSANSGTITAKVIAPGNLWNPLDNDRTVAEASTEVRSPPSDPIELTNVESANNPLPYAYAIRNPRVVGNERVDYGMSDWNIGLGGKIRNRGFNEIDLNPNITANGVNLNEVDYANVYSTNPNINRFSLDPGEERKVRMTTDAESLASNLGNGQINFKLEVTDKEIDLGTIKVSNSSYLINSFDSSSQPERGETIQVSFTGRADGDMIGGEISSPSIVVGTEDREKVIGTVSQSNPQGSNQFKVSGEISIPDQVPKNLVAVAVGSENPESKFKQGAGNEIKILSGTSNLGQSDESSNEDESGSSEDEGGTDSGDEGGGIDSSRISLDGKTVNVGESVGIQVSVPDSRAESGYRIKIKGTDRETSILNRQESSWSPEIQQTSDYTVQVVPATDEGLLSGIVNAVTDPLISKSFEVVSNQPEWISYCSNKEYNMESIEQKASCIEEEIIPEYFGDSTGSNPRVAESLCKDLLGFSYSREDKSCVN